MSKKIQIVSFAPPYPDEYGGVKDVWNRLQAFAQAGYQIYLHCFTYNNEPLDPLIHSTCAEVYTYQRKSLLRAIFSRYPIFIYMRTSSKLLERLLSIDAPILMEGAHSSFYSKYLKNKGKKVLIRVLNLEQNYYRHLYNYEKSWIKRLYYRIESNRLIQYEKNEMSADIFLHINEAESVYFESAYPNAKHLYIPFFANLEPANHEEKLGSHVLIHGNLSVNENHQAAIELIDHLFCNYTDIKVIVAGKNPNSELKGYISRYPHISLVENPSEQEMRNLISNAQVICNYSLSDTGLKLKVIESLLYGRHVIINNRLNHGQKFSDVCHIANDWEEYRNILKKLINTIYTHDMQETRKSLLSNYFDSKAAISKIEAELKLLTK